ncbi:Fic family protein [Candidatus Daviesbacteria bacterium]|nr:Fic family protein [Candidatus Daviesbacteria bacterium]
MEIESPRNLIIEPNLEEIWLGQNALKINLEPKENIIPFPIPIIIKRNFGEIWFDKNNLKIVPEINIIPLRNYRGLNLNLIELFGGLPKWDILTPNPQVKGVPVVTPVKPVDSLPLRDRLVWAAAPADLIERWREADRRRQVSTDSIRDRLLDRYRRHGVDILTQVRLIHRAHMRGNEHYLLYSDQANRALEGVLCTTDRLAGVMRSPQRLALNIHLNGGLVQCASYQRTPEFMQKIATQAERMFPQQGVNPQVDEENIYYYGSAFQYVIVLIHPFYEANGRTSEDSMYILWRRRPDLAHTLRYISHDGLRASENVVHRMRIINNGAYYILLDIGRELGIAPDRLSRVKSYTDLMYALAKRGMPFEQASSAYSRAFDRHIQELIANFTNIDYLKAHPIISALAEHLKQSPNVYRSKAA